MKGAYGQSLFFDYTRLMQPRQTGSVANDDRRRRNHFDPFSWGEEQVADQADVGDLEDRRVAVLVDRDDGAGVR